MGHAIFVQKESAGLKQVCRGKDAEIAANEQEIAAKEKALSDERRRVSSLNDECASLKGSLEGKTEEVQSLQAHITTLQVLKKMYYTCTFYFHSDFLLTE